MGARSIVVICLMVVGCSPADLPIPEQSVRSIS